MGNRVGDEWKEQKQPISQEVDFAAVDRRLKEKGRRVRWFGRGVACAWAMEYYWEEVTVGESRHGIYLLLSLGLQNIFIRI